MEERESGVAAGLMYCQLQQIPHKDVGVRVRVGRRGMGIGGRAGKNMYSACLYYSIAASDEKHKVMHHTVRRMTAMHERRSCALHAVDEVHER